MKLFMEWVQEHYPNYRPSELDEMKIEWLEECILALNMRVYELELKTPKQIQEVEDGHSNL